MGRAHESKPLEYTIATDSTRNWRGISLWILTGLVALAFAGAAISKLAGSDMMIETFARWGLPTWFMYLTGVVEVIGVVALMVPRVSGLGALWLGVEMVVGVGVHWTNSEFVPRSIPAIVLIVLLAFIAYKRRDAITWAFATFRREAGP